jgi:hypothetical protein
MPAYLSDDPHITKLSQTTLAGMLCLVDKPFRGRAQSPRCEVEKTRRKPYRVRDGEAPLNTAIIQLASAYGRYGHCD